MFQNPRTRLMNQPKMFRHIPFVRIIPHFPSKVQNLTVFNYLHDSNSIFRAAGMNAETFFGRTVRVSHFLTAIVSQFLIPSLCESISLVDETRHESGNRRAGNVALRGERSYLGSFGRSTQNYDTGSSESKRPVSESESSLGAGLRR